MGFSSWECARCKKSILSSYACREGIDYEWCKATIVTKDSVSTGVYDGYGRLHMKGGAVLEELYELEPLKIYHERCYEKAGRPSYQKAKKSAHAYDQGFFIEPSEYAGQPGGV